MKTHRRSWMLRAGVVALLSAGALVSVTAPAQAAPGDPTVTITGLDNGNLQPGGRATLAFSIASDVPQSVSITITSGLAPDVTLQHNGNNCGGTCPYIVTLDAGAPKQDSVTLVAAQNPMTVPPGQQRSGNVTIKVDPSVRGAQTVTKDQNITLQGGAAAPTTPSVQTVTEVSGVVKDGTNGNPVNKATVALQDSQGHNYTFTTGTSGTFAFKGNAQNPIAHGVVAVGVEAEGYTSIVKNTPALNPGQTYKFTAAFGMAPVAATPSAAASSTDPGAAGGPSDAGSVASQPNLNPAAKNAGNGSFSTILIALGALLILLGVGAVVYILVRRRKDTDEDGADLEPDGAPLPAGAGRAAYATDAATVARSGGYGQPTMATTRDPLADAPTMLQGRPPLDEYPDPYAAPAPAPVAPRPGYGDATQQYGGSSYGAGYGAGRYDEPTRYADRGGYEDPGAGYRSGGATGNVYGEPEPTGYADRGGYEDPTRAGGYEPPAGGYEPPAGGYGAPAGGYPPRDEYDPRGGYEPRRSAGQYAEPRDPYEGGYESGHARHGGSAPAPSDSRRQLDWLDD